MQTFVFPLNTVLFPGGRLPLRIFEQRYVDMTKHCLRDSAPFGVCLIREGSEVGTPAVPERVGCLATIASWDMPGPNLFEIVAHGTERFRIVEQSVSASGLITAEVETWDAEPEGAPVDARCRRLLELLIQRIGSEVVPSPVRLDDAAWVGYRLAEILPLPNPERQALLELRDPARRLAQLRALLDAP